MKLDNNIPIYSISVVSRLCDTPIRMLREYEKQGLIRPKKFNRRRLFTANETGFIKDIRYYLAEKRMTINGLKEFYLRAACWEIKQCNRRDCPAYGKLNKQCWEVVTHHKICDGSACPSCPIYIIKTSSKGRPEKRHKSHFAYQ
ncbi:MAG: MerR family transcriptional regulator [Planctomycetota bacterium]